MQIKQYWDSFIAILFPPICASCEHVLVHQEQFLCTYCQFHLPITDQHLFHDNAAMLRLRTKAPVEMAAAFLLFAESSLVQTMIHKLKYHHASAIGLYLGRHFAQQLLVSPFFKNLDMIVPLPLHPSKRASRGYNQNEYIAQGIAEILKIPVCADNLVRRVKNPTQTKTRRMERQDKVEVFFACLDDHVFADKHLLLVDDLLTTGATVASAVRVLSSCPGSKVYVAALAMTK